MSDALYDQIGRTYTSTRRPDPRIAATIWRALGDSTIVLNVGAGTGSYEPVDRTVVAVEPSSRMIRQRGGRAARVVQAAAEALPFRQATFDAAMAVLTVHHWTDWRRGVDDMRRVANRLVFFTIDTAALDDFWLTNAYFPEIVALDRERCPTLAEFVHHVGQCSVDHVPIPHDCIDGFLGAFWRRPEAYLDPQVRAGISGLSMLDEGLVARRIARLKADLESGAWEDRFGRIRAAESLDICYRLVVA